MIDVIFCTDIHRSQQINSYHFNDSPGSLAGQSFHLSSENAQNLEDKKNMPGS